MHTKKENYDADLSAAKTLFVERGGITMDWATPEALAGLQDRIDEAFASTWAEGITIDDWVYRASARLS